MANSYESLEQAAALSCPCCEIVLTEMMLMLGDEALEPGSECPACRKADCDDCREEESKDA